MAVMMIEACCTCQDPELPYFEYHTVHTAVSQPSNFSADFGFRLTFDSIEFVTKSDNPFSGRAVFANSAYACDCLPNGMRVKYDIVEINIYPDSVFTDLFDQAESHSSLFRMVTWYNPNYSRNESVRLDSLSAKPFRIPNFRDDELMIYSNQTPVNTDRPYIFEIEVIKENGETLRTFTQAVHWPD